MAAVILPTTGWAAPNNTDQKPTGKESPGKEPTGKKTNGTKIPKILDTAHRHPKRFQLELTSFGGSYLGASLKKSWIAGSRAYFHINNMFAVGAGYGISRVYVGRQDSFGVTLEERNVHYLTAETMIANDVAMRMGKKLLELDLFLTLGVGAINLNSNWDVLGLAGGGLKFYTPVSWLAVRIDVNSYIHRTRHESRTKVDVDLTVTAGLSFLLPPKKKK
jgi:hypothetical protein